MFLLLSEYVKPLEEVERVLESHRDYLKKYYAKGNFICSGRKDPRTGGLIICRAENKQKAEEILHEDPFYIEGIAKYEIIEIIPTMFAEGFDQYL